MTNTTCFKVWFIIRCQVILTNGVNATYENLIMLKASSSPFESWGTNCYKWCKLEGLISHVLKFDFLTKGVDVMYDNLTVLMSSPSKLKIISYVNSNDYLRKGRILWLTSERFFTSTIIKYFLIELENNQYYRIDI